MIRKISVIGLGGIGAAYASKLHDMDPKIIKVIANQNRIQRYKQEGILINNKRYDFNYILPEEDTGAADLIIFAVKYEGLDQAIEDVKHHVGPNTVFLPLLNGISSEEIIAKKYGDKNVLHAMCVGIDAVRVGTSITFSNIGKISFGEKKNISLSSNVEKIKEIFESANIPYEIPKDMLRELWWKFMINVGVNQASTVLKAPYGVFKNFPEANDLMVSAMEEVIFLAEELGINLNRNDIYKFERILKEDLSPKGKTSMLQDIEAGRKTEVEYLAGTVCKMGKDYGVSTPINDMLLRIISVLEKTNVHKVTS